MIDIWNPRWHDRKVLIAKYKVKLGINQIKFSRSRQLFGQVFEMEGEKIASYPIETNGTIDCYAVPLDELLKGEVNALKS